MNAFIIELENKPGGVATVAEAIAAKGINITTVAGLAHGTSGSLALATNDEAGTRSALRAAGLVWRELELIPIALEDKPGSLAAATRRLANAGVNIELAIPVAVGEKPILAVAVDKPDLARTTIAEEVAAGS